MKFTTMLVASSAAALALAGCNGDSTGPNGGNGGPTTQDLDFSGLIGQGDQIEIKGVNGSIFASLTTGAETEVTAVKQGDQSDPSTVGFEVVEHANGVTICAVYPNVPGQPANECLPGEAGNMSVQNNDVEVTFTVRVPAGVVFVGRTVSGNVEATDVESEVLAISVSGNVVASTTEIAEATTVSGNITASIGQPDFGRNLAFTAVSGNLDIEVPANTNAAVVATVVSGLITTEFPLGGTPTNRVGTLGNGGPALTLTTISGNITLRQGPAG